MLSICLYGFEITPVNHIKYLMYQYILRFIIFNVQMLNCCIERKIKREQLYKGYTGQSLEEQKDSDSEEAISSQLTTSDSEPCAPSEAEQSKERGTSGSTATVGKESRERSKQSRKEQQKQASKKEKEDIPAKRPHLDSSSDDDEFFECEDEDEEKDEEKENEEDGEEEEEEDNEEESSEMEVETIKAKVNFVSQLNLINFVN